jgi:hypothetical protein
MATGINAIESYLKGGGKGGGGSSGGRYMSYLILADGESKVIRFLTDIDELELAKFYEFVMDKNGKFQNFVVAPSFHANDPSWQGEDWVRKFGGKTTDYNTKELVEPTPRERIVGIAVEREEVPTEVDGRRVVKTRDMLSQYESREGVQYDQRNFLIVKQAKAFWNTLVGYYHEFGTICDRDYKVTRTGTGREIVYSIIPKAADEGWNTDGSSLAALQASYGYGTGKDVDGNLITPDSEERFLYCTQTLRQWLENQASEERARAALVMDGVDGVTINSSAPAPSWASGAPDEPQAAPAPAATGTDVSSLRARLERHR